MDCRIMVGRHHGKGENINPLNILLNPKLECSTSYTKWLEINSKPYLKDTLNLEREYMRKCYNCELK